jgi:hypothetical protein
MRQQIHSWHLPRQTPGTSISVKYVAISRGWWNYYGSFYPSAMSTVFRHFDFALPFWARRKYKRLAGKKRGSGRWVEQAARRESRNGSCIGVFGSPKTGHWEPYDARVSRTVLRAAAGEDPSAYSPTFGIACSEAAGVRPAKAGAFCGSQSHRGKSRSPVAWVAGSVGKP